MTLMTLLCPGREAAVTEQLVNLQQDLLAVGAELERALREASRKEEEHKAKHGAALTPLFKRLCVREHDDGTSV